MAQPPRVIKKYPNRRLYDTEVSSYITLEDVRQLVVDDVPFEVRDAKSGADLTRQILLQIIAEHEEHGQPILSTRLLSHIIRFYGDAMQGFMGPYLENSLEAFLEQQHKLRGQIDAMMGPTPWSMFSEMNERNVAMWQAMQKNFMQAAGQTGDDHGAKAGAGKSKKRS